METTGSKPHPVQVGIGEWQLSVAVEEAAVIMAHHSCAFSNSMV